MHVIGITGPIGHGKTTFAEALTEVEPRSRHFESSGVIAEVADAWHASLEQPIDVEKWIQHLPGVLRNILAIDCTYEQIEPDHNALRDGSIEYAKLITHVTNLKHNFELSRTPITTQNKETYRPILQWLGGYLVQRIDKAIWYNEIVRRIQLCDSEQIKLCTVGGLRYPIEADVLREVGGVIVKLYRPSLEHRDMLDPTERERDDITVDATVINEGSAEDLRAIAIRLLEDVRAHQVQDIYRP